MSEVWRLQTKTDLSQINTNGISVAEYCINEGVMAMGWTLRESIYKELTPDEQNDLKNQEKEIINDFDKYKKIIEERKYSTVNKKFYDGKVNANVRRLAEGIQNGDFIWIRSKGIYYLGKKTGDSKYLYRYCDNLNDNILKLGVNNQLTNIEWFRIGDESDVPGCISTSFIKGQTLQRIQKLACFEISEILYEEKYKKKYKEELKKIDNKNRNIFKNKMNMNIFYSLLSPNDCEDLLYFFFYHKFKYIAIPSTNKTNTQTYEFVMLSPKNRKKKIYIQAKNGNSEKVDLYLDDYLDLNGKVYLLTTGGKIYQKKDKKEVLKIEFKNNSFMKEISSTKSKKKIYAINPEKLYDFAKEAYKNESILMPHSILQWFEYLK